MSLEVKPGVRLFFKRKHHGRVEYLLHLRKNTTFHDGDYCVPGGHVEGLETFTQCAIREAKEELGVTVRKQDLRGVHLVYRRGYKTSRVNEKNKITKLNEIRPDQCFLIDKWKGTPRQAEKKHGTPQWFSFDEIPSNTVPYVIQALDCIEKKIQYSEHCF